MGALDVSAHSVRVERGKQQLRDEGLLGLLWTVSHTSQSVSRWLAGEVHTADTVTERITDIILNATWPWTAPWNRKRTIVDK